jgi:anti-sigma B factor antagonist
VRTRAFASGLTAPSPGHVQAELRDECAFRPPVEEEIARVFDEHGIVWKYEPHTFVLERNRDGARRPLEAQATGARRASAAGVARARTDARVVSEAAGTNGFGSAAAAAFHIDELSPGAMTVFSVHGELDLHEAPELEDRIATAVGRGARMIVVDLTDVTFIDSMALGVLLAAVKRLRPTGGRLRLVVPNTNIRRIFEISLLDQVFTLDSTRDEALAAGKTQR